MLVWRICARKFSRTAFSGEGAFHEGGRWNRPGTALVYTSATLALAALEFLVNAEADGWPPLVSIAADIPAALPVTSIEIQDLPPDWRAYPAPQTIQSIGSRWMRAGKTSVLSVPSVVIPEERNYLLNPVHRDFVRIKLSEPKAFALDSRLRK